MRQSLDQYFTVLSDLLRNVEVTDSTSNRLSLDQGCEWLRQAARRSHNLGRKIIFLGNGGSASIASHLAIDFSKNGGLRAIAFNDAAALTCLGNDFGYENVFAKQLEFYADPDDLLVAISSSGQSPNILGAVGVARTRNCRVATFSGFTQDNELRRSGDMNFYVRSNTYGFVEIAHLTLCHAILDIDMGFGQSL